MLFRSLQRAAHMPARPPHYDPLERVCAGAPVRAQIKIGINQASMHALWLQDRQLRLRADVPVPEPAAGEALVRVLCAGICSTDLELVRGYYPYCGVLGHEFAGIVESGPAQLRGRRVVGEINASCGACEQCMRGQPTHCLQRTVLGIVKRDGCFAQYLTLPAANLHVVPDEVSTAAATFTEPLWRLPWRLKRRCRASCASAYW